MAFDLDKSMIGPVEWLRVYVDPAIKDVRDEPASYSRTSSAAYQIHTLVNRVYHYLRVHGTDRWESEDKFFDEIAALFPSLADLRRLSLAHKHHYASHHHAKVARVTPSVDPNDFTATGTTKLGVALDIGGEPFPVVALPNGQVMLTLLDRSRADLLKLFGMYGIVS